MQTFQNVPLAHRDRAQDITLVVHVGDVFAGILGTISDSLLVLVAHTLVRIAADAGMSAWAVDMTSVDDASLLATARTSSTATTAACF